MLGDVAEAIASEATEIFAELDRVQGGAVETRGRRKGG
jgi:hypothetical protein